MAISRSSRAAALFVVGVAALAVGAAACGSKSSSGHPTPSPTPFTATNCEIGWFTAQAAPGKYDAYVVDMPLASWTSGTKTFDGSGTLGTFYRGLDLSSQAYDVAAVATAGTFLVSVSNGTAAGESVGFTDPDVQAYEQGGVAVATGGDGSFHGVWSDSGPASNPSYGAGTINMMWQGSSFLLGQDAALAVCYDASAFESASRAPSSALLRGVLLPNGWR